MNGLYASTKWAIEALTETLHYEVRRFGIRVVSIQPGYTATAWSGNERWLGVDQPPWDELYGMVKALDEEGQGEAVPPEQVARVIVEAIEADDPPLRMAVGEELAEVIDLRRRTTDREWEQRVDEFRPFRW